MRRWQHCTSTEQPKLGSLRSEHELYSPTYAHPIPSSEAAPSFLWLPPCKVALSIYLHACSPSESASLWGTPSWTRLPVLLLFMKLSLPTVSFIPHLLTSVIFHQMLPSLKCLPTFLGCVWCLQLNSPLQNRTVLSALPCLPVAITSHS